MANPKIGLQLSTVAPVIRKIGLYETLKQVAEIGIHHVEVSQVTMNEENIALLLKAKKNFGIQVSAMTAMLAPMGNQYDAWFDNLEQNFDKIVADCKAVGATAVRIGATSPAACGSYEAAVAFAAQTDAMGKKLKEYGIDLYFHTHHFELAMHNGKTVLDILKDHGDNYGFELDIHWIQRGGFNPVKVIENYDGRVRLLHLKDYRVNGAKYAQLGMGGDSLNAIVEFAEVGEGSLPIAECIETGIRCGCEFFFIEQDKTYDRTPLEAVKISYENLCAMGYADMFKA